MHLLYLTILLPLLGAVVNGLLLRQVSPRLSHITGVLPLLASFIMAIVVCVNFFGGTAEAQVLVAYDWLRAGNFSAPLALRIDQLSLLMLLVVTGIGTLIHIFAGGYMHEEARTSRFFLLSQSLCLHDAAVDNERKSARHVRRLGRCRAVQLLVNRLLV